MGACECNTPVDIIYEINSQSNESKNSKGIKKEVNSQILKNIFKNNTRNNDNMLTSFDSPTNKNNSIGKFNGFSVNDSNQISNEKNEKDLQINNNINNHLFAQEKVFSNLSCTIPENKRMDLNGRVIFHCRSSNNCINNDNYGIEEIPQDEFSKFIFEKINQIRENPSSFIDIIENAKKNISVDEKRGIFIYKTTAKIALYKGEQSFNEAIEILKKLKPMEKLIYRSELVVPPPNNLQDLENKQYMNEKINEIVESGVFVKSFWRDIIKDPKTCFILMIVDDTGLNGGLKRDDILDQDTKYIGISSKLIGKKFACYITLG